MSADNYARTITVAATPEQAYQALTAGFEHWWTIPNRTIADVGDQARFGFPPGLTYWTFQATHLSPGERVELECVDALHIHAGQPKEIETEWLGTKAVWRIDARDENTDIHFDHIGLKPTLLCFGICQAGWDLFFVDSLKAYLDTGVGKPHRPPA
jgi:hypothetical protein